MSREDPQFKLRMPLELRAKAEQSAKAAGRSLNSELIARIESSYLPEMKEELLKAERAHELAVLARMEIPQEIMRRVVEEISKSVRRGHTAVAVSLSDLQLETGLSEMDLDKLISQVRHELESAGYKVDWDDISILWIEF